MGGMGRTKWEANEKQSDRTKTHHPNRSFLVRFGVEKVSGEHVFQTNIKNKSESEKGCREGLDGKSNGYTRGHGGAEKRKC